MSEPPRKSSSNFRKFFVRGLAILLPTVLTIWILMAAYMFVQNRIAGPINAGVRWSLLVMTDFPQPTDEDFDAAFDLRPTLRAQFEEYEATQGALLGETYLNRGRAERRRDWFHATDVAMLAARVEAIDREWNAVAIGDWALLDLIGIVIAVFLIYLVGAFLGSFIGRRVYLRGEAWLQRVPLFKHVYPHVKQVVEFLVGNGGDDDKTFKFNRVVGVEYPRKGIWSVGLVTGGTMSLIQDAAGQHCLTIFIPSSPTPFTGYVITVPEGDTIDLPISIDDALRFAVSGGVIIPEGQRINPSLPDESN